ncbi:SH3 domain-containing protein [Aristaeella hokkaidonensis]|nr:SH3 domain-containing protein [Aristaeella hokkaidonensis]SNT92811.1 SH3 domain-containing protein [Aristaeella hokkaidonensis]
MMNRYGKTNSKVFFRKDPSTKSSKLSQLGKNTYVYMIHTKEYDNNEVWTYAQVNGKTGYIMTEYLDALTEEDSAAWDKAQSSPAPIYSGEEFFATATPTTAPTATPTTAPTATPTTAPTPTPTTVPTATPTTAPTDTPTTAPTATPTTAPTDTPTTAPTATPYVATDTPAPAPTPVEPTQEPPQRSGYGITIGDGIPVRERPTAASAIKEELPVNKIVYVYGQIYQDGIAWHEIEHDGRWGFVRADLIRIMSYGEMAAYEEKLQPQDTPIPNVTIAPYTYDPNELSCYGYVTTDAVNFRTEPSSSSRRIRLMKRYATFIVYGSVQADGETWYKVSYDGQMGYLNGKYFKQMTVSEAEQFLQSDKYREGLTNNSTQSTTNNNTGSSPTTTGSPTGIVTAEDQKVSEWVNPAAGAAVSYKPFDPFATPEPLPENEFENNEFVNSLIDQVKAGTMKQEELKMELEKFYKDAADPAAVVDRAMAYIEGKTELATEEPSQSPEPLATEEITEFPQEQSTGGGAGWVAAGLVLAAGAGGGYYWYLQRERKRKAAQRMAQKRVAQQNRAAQQNKPRTAAQPGTGNGTGTGNAASAQNAARVRTGNYTGSAGTTKPRVTPTTPSSGTGNGKTYGTGTKNPYGRYTRSGSDEESAYTASFKPEGGEPRPRRSRSGDSDQTPEA